MRDQQDGAVGKENASRSSLTAQDRSPKSTKMERQK